MSLLLHEELNTEMSATELKDRLIVTPLLDPAQIGPGSIDLRLGTEFIESERRSEALIDPYDTASLNAAGESEVYVPLGQHLVLHPGQFVLGATLEFVRLPAHLGAQVLSRSSWGRLGLLVATAVAVQPGFAGCLTLELVNAGSLPIRLRPGLRVAQLQVWSAKTATGSPYATGFEKYRAPLGPESNRLAWESSELDRIRRIGAKLLGNRER
jgi:dCTP deaminase